MTYIYNQSANILTGGNVNWALIGVRNTLALNLFYLKTELLPDARIPPTFLVFNNNIQQGGGITLSHTLTPVISLNGTLSTQYTRGIRTERGTEHPPEDSRARRPTGRCRRAARCLSARATSTRTRTAPHSADTESSEFAIFTGLFHRL